MESIFARKVLAGAVVWTAGISEYILEVLGDMISP